MPASVEGLPFPNHPFRWLLAHAFGWALLMTLFALVRRRVRQPSLPYMSERWLLSHQKEFARFDY